MSAFKTFVAAVVLGVLVGCAAEGPLHKEVATSFPTIPDGKGRIYFYRTSSGMGAAVTSDITLNGRVVGKSQLAGFFFVDENPGSCKASASTEVEREVTFTLAAGETKYIKSSVSMGLMVGRINLELVSPSDAIKDLPELHYMGTAVKK